VVDLDQQCLLAQIARRGPWNDCASLPAVVQRASEQTPIGLVLADAEFDSERNHTYIRQRLGAQSVIPARRGKKTWRVRGERAEMRRAFLRRIYRHRALIESVFSSVKRKLSARAPGRLLPMQQHQALLLGLSFNLYRLKHCYLSLRMSTEPHGLKIFLDKDRTPGYEVSCGVAVLVPHCRLSALKPGEPHRIGAKTVRPFMKLSGNGRHGRSASPQVPAVSRRCHNK